MPGDEKRKTMMVAFVIFNLAFTPLIVILFATVAAAQEAVQAAAPTLPTASRFSLTQHEFAWTFGQTAERTYLFSNCHWWESIDHQLTSVITLLTIAQNTSSVAVVPTLASTTSPSSTSTSGSSSNNSSNGGGIPPPNSESLLGDYFDLARVRQIQPAMTLGEFLSSADYTTLLNESNSGTTIALPKESQEEYERKLKLFGRLRASTIHLQMPDVDPENTNQPCHRFGGTMHLSADGKVRYVFLDRIHFLHFCTEKFMPWWYDIRQHIRPRPEFFQVARGFIRGAGGSVVRQPLAVIHVNDVMEAQKEREGEDVDRYAGEIVDGLRSNGQLGTGGVYMIYMKSGRNVRKVVSLLQNEMDTVYDCTDMFNCLHDLPQGEHNMIEQGQGDGGGHWKERMKMKMNGGGAQQHVIWATEWALAADAELFIGNVHSPLSRNVCLYRKTQGKPYAIGRGFAELRKVWKWNL